MDTLQLTLLLLGSAVGAVILFRRLDLPPVLGYLVVGALLGPHAFSFMKNTEGAQHLAEFGVVFLMFSIGLEFSLNKLRAMKRIVFGLGGLQVIICLLIAMIICMIVGLKWQAGIALGGALAMSSTAVLVKLLTDRLELDSRHGREIVGVLLFQDLAVVPLLILIPAFSQPPEVMMEMLGFALLKAIAVLSLVLYFGQRLMKRWFHIVVRSKSPELFMLNVLLITLALAYITQLAGLSLALGAFVAGMLISETDYRYQVEEDIKPFRDILMGLFFITIGMLLDMQNIVANIWAVLAILAALLVVKFAVVFFLSRFFNGMTGTALRSGLWLCAGGEFGFVLLAEIKKSSFASTTGVQVVLAALVLSMLLAPVIIHFSERIVMRFVSSEWLQRSIQLTKIAAQTMTVEQHVILCGFGRCGQYLNRLLTKEGVDTFAFDLDPDRVREASAAGEHVVYGDATRKEALMAAGIQRAKALIITFASLSAAERVIRIAHQICPQLPIIARVADERDIDRLTKAGATEVVPETVEASLMLASHTLVLLGVPFTRIARSLRHIRAQRYQLLRGFFYGSDDEEGGDEDPDREAVRLHAVTLASGAFAVGKTLGELGLLDLNVDVQMVRRLGQRIVDLSPTLVLAAGDLVVLFGQPQALENAQTRLLEGDI